MQIGSCNQSQAYACHRPPSPAATPDAQTEATRGQRVLARHDQDGDGLLSAAELKDTRLGRKMSVDQFAKADTDGDGKLGAAEIDAALPQRHGGYHGQMAESSVNARIADYLSAKPATEDPSVDVTARIMANLDRDHSGGLNSEEIAGTRLASAVGNGFYDLDADKSGTLDAAELGGFVADYLSGSAAPAVASTADPVAPAAGGPTAAATDTVSDVASATPADAADPAKDAAPDPEAVATGTAAAYAQRIASAFEAALKILQGGTDTGGANALA